MHSSDNPLPVDFQGFANLPRTRGRVMPLWTTEQLEQVAATAANLGENTTAESAARCNSTVGPHMCAGHLYVKRMPETGEFRWHCPICLNEGVIRLGDSGA
jgi:hypothetical protein